MSGFINILVADDDIDDHEFFREALRRLTLNGQKASELVQVASVYNGTQALEYLLRKGVYAKATDPVPDFLVLDLNMPILDGFTVLKEMQKHIALKNIPVYVLTTSRDEKHKVLCRELGCAGFFSKPPKIEELTKVIERILKPDAE